MKAKKKPFERKLTVRSSINKINDRAEIMGHLNMQAGISPNRVTKPSTSATTKSEPRIEELFESDSEQE